MLRRLIAVAACLIGVAPAQPLGFNATEVAELDFDATTGGGDLWGEDDLVAVALREGGVALVDVSDPGAPLVTDTWDPGNVFVHDVKIAAGHLAAANELYDGVGIYILDVSDPYDLSLAATIEVAPGTEACRNLWLDRRGYLYCAVSSFVTGGQVRIFDVRDLQAIAQVGVFDYPGLGADPQWVDIDDLTVQGSVLYMGWLEGGAVMADVSDPANPTQIGNNILHESSYTHAVWPTEDGDYLLSSDARAGGQVRIWDVRDPDNIVQVAAYASHPDAIAHNIVVKGDLAYVAYFEEGVRILDISEPANPVEVAFYDTYLPETQGRFEGTWGIWPLQSAGNEPGEPEWIYSSERSGKMVVVELAGPRKAKIWGELTHGDDGSPVPLATILLRQSGRSVRSDTIGLYALQTGACQAKVEVSAFGAQPDSFSELLSPGQVRRHDLSLTRVSSPTVVIVDDDDGAERQQAAQEWLDSLAVGWLTWDGTRDGPLPLARLAPFDPAPAILWMTGAAASETVTPSEQDSIGAIAAAGHAVCLSGQYIGDELGAGNSWMNDTFGADHVADRVSLPVLEGIEGDPITAGMLLMLDTGSPEREQESAGEVAAVATGEPLLAYASMGRYAGVRRQGMQNRTVFLAFGLEGIAAADGFTDPTRFLAQMLRWFGVEVAITGEGGSAPAGASRARLVPNAPNPFNPATRIGFEIDGDGPTPVRLRLHDGAGRWVATLIDRPLTGGRHTARWDGTDEAGRPVASGRYICSLEALGVVERRSVVLVK